MTITDALVAVQVVEMSFVTDGLLHLESVLHSDFPARPDEEAMAVEVSVRSKPTPEWRQGCLEWLGSLSIQINI